MAVRIRLARHGRKGSPFYHIVAADSRSPRDGKFIEKIGTFNPMTHPATIDLKFDRALYWLQVGAKPSETAETILRKEGVLYKKHLLGGIKKGAFDETVADEKFQAWLEQKRKSEETIVEKLSSESKKDAEKRIEAEKKVNEARAEKIAAKLKQEEVVESTTDENVESTDSNVEETVAE